MGCSTALCGLVREATGIYEQEGNGWDRGLRASLGTKVRWIMRWTRDKDEER